jgi:hypothetical protein
VHFVTQFSTDDYKAPDFTAVSLESWAPNYIHNIKKQLETGPTYRADLKLDPDLEDQINRPLTKEDFAGEYRPLTVAPLVWADPNNSETPQADYVAEHILKMQKQK